MHYEYIIPYLWERMEVVDHDATITDIAPYATDIAPFYLPMSPHRFTQYNEAIRARALTLSLHASHVIARDDTTGKWVRDHLADTYSEMVKQYGWNTVTYRYNGYRLRQSLPNRRGTKELDTGSMVGGDHISTVQSLPVQLIGAMRRTVTHDMGNVPRKWSDGSEVTRLTWSPEHNDSPIHTSTEWNRSTRGTARRPYPSAQYRWNIVDGIETKLVMRSSGRIPLGYSDIDISERDPMNGLSDILDTLDTRREKAYLIWRDSTTVDEFGNAKLKRDALHGELWELLSYYRCPVCTRTTDELPTAERVTAHSANCDGSIELVTIRARLNEKGKLIRGLERSLDNGYVRIVGGKYANRMGIATRPDVSPPIMDSSPFRGKSKLSVWNKGADIDNEPIPSACTRCASTLKDLPTLKELDAHRLMCDGDYVRLTPSESVETYGERSYVGAGKSHKRRDSTLTWSFFDEYSSKYFDRPRWEESLASWISEIDDHDAQVSSQLSSIGAAMGNGKTVWSRDAFLPLRRIGAKKVVKTVTRKGEIVERTVTWVPIMVDDQKTYTGKARRLNTEHGTVSAMNGFGLSVGQWREYGLFDPSKITYRDSPQHSPQKTKDDPIPDRVAYVPASNVESHSVGMVLTSTGRVPAIRNRAVKVGPVTKGRKKGSTNKPKVVKVSTTVKTTRGPSNAEIASYKVKPDVSNVPMLPLAPKARPLASL